MNENSLPAQQGDLQPFYAEFGAINQLPDVWTLLMDEGGEQVLNTIAPFGSAPLPAPPQEAADRRLQAVPAGLLAAIEAAVAGAAQAQGWRPPVPTP